MPLFTILIPTFDHGEMIRVAVDSVLEQTLQDFEILVVGDGVTPETRAVVESVARDVPELRFFDLPKEAGRCAANRHRALAEACGEIVCYLDDDDFWFPEHLETLASALSGADFAHTTQIMVLPDYRVLGLHADLSLPAVRARMANEAFNFIGPGVVGHTLAAYRRLPLGWAAAPEGVWNDLQMWRKFLADPALRTVSVHRITAVHFPGSRRTNWTPEQRTGEVRFWRAVLRDTEVRARLDRLVNDSAPLPMDYGAERWDTVASFEEIVLGTAAGSEARAPSPARRARAPSRSPS